MPKVNRNDLHALKDALGERRGSDLSFRAGVDQLYAQTEAHRDRFYRQNQRSIDSMRDKAESSVLICGDYSEMFEDMLEAQGILGPEFARTVDEKTGTQLFDLRGIIFRHWPALDGMVFRYFDFSFSRVQGENCFFHCTISDCIFEHAELRGGSLDHYTHRSRFVSSDLREASMTMSCFDDCLFDDCRMSAIRLHTGLVSSCRFVKCDLRKAEFGTSRFIDCVFEGCNFRQSFMDMAEYTNCRFVGCDFAHTWDKFVPPGVVG